MKATLLPSHAKAPGRSTVRSAVIAVALGAIVVSLTAKADADPLALTDTKAQGAVNYKALPGESITVYFTVKNVGRSISGDVRARMYFCRTKDPATCNGDPAHSAGQEVRIGELLSEGRNRKWAYVGSAEFKVPSSAQEGTRYVRLIVRSQGTSLSDAPEEFIPFELVEKVCKKKKGKECLAWRDPRMDGGPAPVR